MFENEELYPKFTIIVNLGYYCCFCPSCYIFVYYYYFFININFFFFFACEFFQKFIYLLSLFVLLSCIISFFYLYYYIFSFLLLYVWFGHPWCTNSRFLTLVLTELLLMVTWRTWSTTSPSALCMHLPGAGAEGRFRGKIYKNIQNIRTQVPMGAYAYLEQTK